MSSKLELVAYSEKAIVVFGETKVCIDNMKELGGKFNPALKYNENDKKPGWVFSKKSNDKVKEFIEKYNAGLIQGTSSSSKSVASSSSSSSSSPTIDIKVFMALVSRVERLEQEVKLLHKQLKIEGKNEVHEEPEEVFEEEEDEDKPITTKRLIKK